MFEEENLINFNSSDLLNSYFSFNEDESERIFFEKNLLRENNEFYESIAFDSIIRETSQSSFLGKNSKREECMMEIPEKEKINDFRNFNLINNDLELNISINNNIQSKISPFREKYINESNENSKIFKFEMGNPKKFGRKRKEDKKIGRNGLHTKKNEDNKIRKIKVFFFKSIYNYLRKYLIKDLLKLNPEISESLKRNFNLNLFKKTLKDIYCETIISEKYTTKKIETNADLINKIIEENKNLQAIKILNLTYFEVFEIFRRNLKPSKEISLELEEKIEGTNILDPKYFEDAEIFIQKLKKKGINEKDLDLEEYIKDVKRLILQFENWFLIKIGRK